MISEEILREIRKRRLRGDNRFYGNVEFDNFLITSIGGFAVKLINGSGADLTEGRIVRTTNVTGTFDLAAANEFQSIGALYADCADGEAGWIVTGGIGYMAMSDNTAATAGNWVYTVAEAGYANATLAAPPGGGIPELDTHMREIGHCLETVAAGGAGTHILARCLIHFN